MHHIQELDMSLARRLRWLVIGALVGNAAIVLVVVPLLSTLLGRFYGIGFADDYDTLALNVAQGFGYRLLPDGGQTLMREPAYPLFLAGVFKIFGYGIEGARVANVLLVIAITTMIVRLARIVSDESSVPAVAALLFLFHPGTLVAELRGSVEISFICVLLAFVLVLHRALIKKEASAYVLAGCVLGLVVLTRSTPMLFPVVVLAYLVATSADVRERLRCFVHVGLLVVSMLIVMTPWIVRNWMLTGQFVPTASVQGVAAQTGQYICSQLSFHDNFLDLDRAAARERDALARAFGRPFNAGYYQYFYSPDDELAFNKLLLRTVTSKYRQDPMLFLKCPSVNLFNFWFAGKTWRVTWINVLFQLPFMVTAFAGAYLIWRRGEVRRIAIPLLFVVYLFALHVPIHAQARYSVPLVPFLAVFAAVTLMSIRDRTPFRHLAVSRVRSYLVATR